MNKKIFLVLLGFILVAYGCGGGGGSSSGGTDLPPDIGSNDNKVSKIILTSSDTLATANQSILLYIKAFNAAGQPAKLADIDVKFSSSSATTGLSADGVNYVNHNITVKTDNNGYAKAWVNYSTSGMITVYATSLNTLTTAARSIKYVTSEFSRFTNLDPVTLIFSMDNNGNGVYNEAEDFSVCGEKNIRDIRLKVKVKIGAKNIANKKIILTTDNNKLIEFNDSDKTKMAITTDINGEAEAYATAICGSVLKRFNVYTANIIAETEDIFIDSLSSNFKGTGRQTVFFIPTDEPIVKVLGIDLDIKNQLYSGDVETLSLRVVTNPDINLPEGEGIAVKLWSTCGNIEQTDIMTKEDKTGLTKFTAPIVTKNTVCTIGARANGVETTKSVIIYPVFKSLINQVEFVQSKKEDQSTKIVLIGGIPPYKVISSHENAILGTVAMQGESGLSLLTITVKKGFIGEGKLTVIDKENNYVEIKIIVKAPDPNQGFRALMPQIDAVYSDVAQALTTIVVGGTPPYKVFSSNSNVSASVLSSDNELGMAVISINIAGGFSGNATITIFDKNGDIVTIKVSVIQTGDSGN